VYRDEVFTSGPLFSSDGDFLDYSPKTVSAIMHGDNADEGNIFREDARMPSKMSELERTAVDGLGQTGADTLLELYGLDPGSLHGVNPKEKAHRLHRFPEDARFYLLSERLNNIWPASAFYHLAAKSPFRYSRYPNDAFHELDNLFLFGNFDRFLVDEPGGEHHLRLGEEMRLAWISFVNGEAPWPDAFERVSARFGKEKTAFMPREQVRQWDDRRKDRLTRLGALGIGNIVKIATVVFP
jgi:carboxylesterase type B